MRLRILYRWLFQGLKRHFPLRFQLALQALCFLHSRSVQGANEQFQIVFHKVRQIPLIIAADDLPHSLEIAVALTGNEGADADVQEEIVSVAQQNRVGYQPSKTLIRFLEWPRCQDIRLSDSRLDQRMDAHVSKESVELTHPVRQHMR